MTSDRVEDRGFAEVGQFTEADATYTVDGVRGVPCGSDWVLVLGDDVDAGHWRLSEVQPSERFALQGRVFETADIDADGDLEVRASGDVLGRVQQTHVRGSDVVIDLVVSGAGGDETITGTPEHPFWVPAVGDYVAMGDLEVGTVLRTEGGGDAGVASIQWREGDFEVFNFEVAGVHNYFVRAPASEGDAVLVHNGCGPDIDKIAESAAQPKKGGLSRAGHALDKHGAGQRADEVSAFPSPKGNATQKNADAQFQVEDILTDPGSEIKSLGKGGWQVTAPDGRAVRTKPDGETFDTFVTETE